MDDVHHQSARPTRRLRRIAVSIGCIALGIIGGLVVFALTTVRRPPPAMSAADFEAAVARWRAQRPESYTMTLDVSGNLQGTMHIVVKKSTPTMVERNGAAIAGHSWSYWTVDGLFAIIRTDLENLDQPERAFGVKDVSQLVQQAEFDPELGYPRRYRRAVRSTGDAIEWDIVEFHIE
jgi:hypothetical protein